MIVPDYLSADLRARIKGAAGFDGIRWWLFGGLIHLSDHDLQDLAESGFGLDIIGGTRKEPVELELHRRELSVLPALRLSSDSADAYGNLDLIEHLSHLSELRIKFHSDRLSFAELHNLKILEASGESATSAAGLPRLEQVDLTWDVLPQSVVFESPIARLAINCESDVTNLGIVSEPRHLRSLAIGGASRVDLEPIVRDAVKLEELELAHVRYVTGSYSIAHLREVKLLRLLAVKVVDDVRPWLDLDTGISISVEENYAFPREMTKTCKSDNAWFDDFIPALGNATFPFDVKITPSVVAMSFSAWDMLDAYTAGRLRSASPVSTDMLVQVSAGFLRTKGFKFDDDSEADELSLVFDDALTAEAAARALGDRWRSGELLNDLMEIAATEGSNRGNEIQ